MLVMLVYCIRKTLAFIIYRNHIKEAGYKFVKRQGNARSIIISRSRVVVDRLEYVRAIQK